MKIIACEINHSIDLENDIVISLFTPTIKDWLLNDATMLDRARCIHSLHKQETLEFLAELN